MQNEPTVIGPRPAFDGLQLATTLSGLASVDDVLVLALGAAMEQVQAACGCLYLRDGNGPDRLAASRGAGSPAPAVADLGAFASGALVLRESGERPAVFETLGAAVLCPV